MNELELMLRAKAAGMLFEVLCALAARDPVRAWDQLRDPDRILTHDVRAASTVAITEHGWSPAVRGLVITFLGEIADGCYELPSDLDDNEDLEARRLLFALVICVTYLEMLVRPDQGGEL